LPGRSFSRADDGAVTVDLPADDLSVLGNLAAEMRGLLEGELPDDVRARLYPKAYDDESLEVEYRGLMARDLEERKVSDLTTMSQTLSREAPFSLSLDEAAAWLGALQDMRLTLAVMLGIEEDGWESEEDLSDPQLGLLHYLGFVQESLVGVLGV
jgi:uncharacterized protein DUF2017